MTLTPLEVEYLAAQPLGRLATVQRNGQPQASPMAFVWNPGTQTIDMVGFRMQKTQKWKNVETNPKIAFVVDDLISTDPWKMRMLEIRGTVEMLLNPTDVVRPGGDGAVMRLHPVKVISMGIDPDVPFSRPAA
ncbi:MAG: pyridoxamine 5-phosphate oxidase [Pseudonocardiales bacterium]|nr:pyridoxamine 5-phosphate oxidase [Jatrophihabitantaceae bacterium]MCW2603992.1 pyridoxamine 5-phosphate oxidase [Pseudonocardiales bacterium]